MTKYLYHHCRCRTLLLFVRRRRTDPRRAKKRETKKSDPQTKTESTAQSQNPAKAEEVNRQIKEWMPPPDREGGELRR